eukprot:TRINITY_DN4969_c0_g1_i1.p2 TRINITY_DN4969_c0_g1~~TRINITY_DN4969_c0_g1_i1.p2  ORF type:complete len:368 (+),score=74.45 TRINITY_DN4969_c0_g1_i1:34-1104(+)
MDTIAHVTNILVSLMAAGHQKAVVEQMTWKALGILCTEPDSTKKSSSPTAAVDLAPTIEGDASDHHRHQQQQHPILLRSTMLSSVTPSSSTPAHLLAQALSPVIAELSLGEKAQTMTKPSSVERMRKLVLTDDPVVKHDVARTIANIALHDELATKLSRNGALQILDSIIRKVHSNNNTRSTDSDAPLIRPIARAVANLSRNDHNKEELTKQGWIPKLSSWLNERIPGGAGIDTQLSLAALVALGNLMFASNTNVITRNGAALTSAQQQEQQPQQHAPYQLQQQQQQVVIPPMIELARRLAQVRADGADVHHNAQLIQLCQQLLRSVANIAQCRMTVSLCCIYLYIHMLFVMLFNS